MQKTESKKKWCGDLQKVNPYERALFFKERFSDMLGWRMQMGLMCRPETSVRNYHKIAGY